MPRVALIQVDVSDLETPAQRITQVVQQIRDLKGSCDVVILPELWAIGPFNTSQFQELSGRLDGNLLTLLTTTAREAHVWLHAGSFISGEMDTLTNTAVVISPAGETVATYQKIHLFGFEHGEAEYFSRGENLVCFSDAELGTVGLATCYDLRFPELFRGLTKLGAESFFIASGWPVTRIEHWRVLLQARAIENQAWVIACNSVGANEAATLGGHSMVIDPMGNIVTEADDRPGVIFADVDINQALAWRNDFPVLKDRVLD